MIAPPWACAAVCLSFLFFTSGISADSLADAEEALIVEELITTGKMPRPLSQVSGSITLIESEDINRQLVGDIAGLVRYEPGVQVGNQGARFGYSSYSIRGIGGNRVAIEVDGVPIADQFKIGSYSNSGRNFIDPDLVQQVEILRGPASSVYGSEAIGGVVSYTTFDAKDLVEPGQKVASRFKNTLHSINNSKSISYLGAVDMGSSSMLLSLKRAQGEELENQADSGFSSDLQESENLNIQFKYAYEFSEQHTIKLSLENSKRESITDIYSFIGRGRFSSTLGLSGDDSSHRKNYLFSWEYDSLEDSFLSGGVLRAYRQQSKTEQLSDETRFSRGVNYFYDRDFFFDQELNGIRLNLYGNVQIGNVSHRIGYGIELSESRTEELRNSLQTNLDENSSTNVVLSEVFPVRDFPVSDTQKIGVYINDEIQFADSWSLIAGVRADSYSLKPEVDPIFLEDNPDTPLVSIEESSVSPKLGLNYHFSEVSKVYLQYLHGYRAPPFEDANIGFYIPLFGYRAIPNPELKSESSDGFELGFQHRSDKGRFELLTFYNDYEDFIQSRVNLGVDPDTGLTTFQSQNIQSAKIYGAELRYRQTWAQVFESNFTLEAWINAFWSKGENRGTGYGLNSVEPAQAVSGVSLIQPFTRWSVDVFVTSVVEKNDYDENVENAFVPPGYTTIDMIFNYDFNDSLSLGLGVFNLGDKKYWNWSDINGLTVEDPLVQVLSSAGTNGSLNLRFYW